MDLRPPVDVLVQGSNSGKVAFMFRNLVSNAGDWGWGGERDCPYHKHVGIGETMR